MIPAIIAAVIVSSNSVTFTARSTDCGVDMPLEFLFVGPGSDRDYESMFVTEDDAGKIAEAFRKAGIPTGEPMSVSDCRFWPIGSKLEMKPDLWTIIRDQRNERKQPVVYTGGTRDINGNPEATTNMPAAVFALYNCPQSLMQFDDTLDQSTVYGRFLPAVKIPKGEVRKFTFTWKGASNGGKHVTTPDFPPEMTVGEAVKKAGILAALDSPETKVNGFKKGQFYYRAFLPLEAWKDRSQRLAQPYEVRITGEGKAELTVITEDWSDTSSTDPKLIVERKKFEELTEDKKVNTCLIYVGKNVKLAEVYRITALVPKNVVNWYVFAE